MMRFGPYRRTLRPGLVFEATKRTLFALVLGFVTVAAAAQNKIDVRYLGSKFQDTAVYRDVLVVFLLSTADTADFPPMINFPPKCTVFENGFEKVVLLTPHNTGLSLDDHNVRTKNPAIYEIVKDSISQLSFDGKMLVTYIIKDVPFRFGRMSLTPSFTEKRDPLARYSRRFEFDVSP